MFSRRNLYNSTVAGKVVHTFEQSLPRFVQHFGNVVSFHNLLGGEDIGIRKHGPTRLSGWGVQLLKNKLE
jgi:hypothetical protein